MSAGEREVSECTKKYRLLSYLYSFEHLFEI